MTDCSIVGIFNHIISAFNQSVFSVSHSKRRLDKITAFPTLLGDGGDGGAGNVGGGDTAHQSTDSHIGGIAKVNGQRMVTFGDIEVGHGAAFANVVNEVVTLVKRKAQCPVGSFVILCACFTGDGGIFSNGEACDMFAFADDVSAFKIAFIVDAAIIPRRLHVAWSGIITVGK